MLNFNSLTLHNYALWRDINFEFQEGLTFISGANRSGKSLLFKAIKPILYGETKVPLGSHSSLGFTLNDVDMAFEATRSGKTNRYTAIIDGVNQETGRIADTRAIIDKYINIPSSLFSSTVLLDGTKPHPLAGGSPSSRLEWLYEVLAFAGAYEVLKKKVDKELLAINKQATEATLLKAQLDGLKVVEKPTQDHEELEAELKEAKVTLTKANKVIDQIEQIQSTNVKPQKHSPEEYKRLIKKSRKRLVKLRKQHSEYEEQLDYYRAHKKLTKKYESAKVHYKEVCKEHGVKAKKPSAALEYYAEACEELKIAIKKASDNNDLYEEQRPIRKWASKSLKWLPDKTLADLQEIEDNARLLRSKAQQTLDLHKEGVEACPTCGNDVKLTKKSLKAAKDAVKQADNKLSALHSERKIKKAKEFDLVKLVDVSKYKAELKVCQQLEEAAGAVVESQSLLEAIDEPDGKPVKVDVSEIKTLKETLVEYEERLSKAQQYQASMTILKDNPFANKTKEQLADRLTKARRARKKASEVINDAQDRIVSLRTQSSLYRNYRQSHKDLKERYDEVKKAVPKQRMFKTLKVALGRDGLPARNLEKGLELFLEGLNLYAPIVWDETFKFEAEVGARRMDVIAHRSKQSETIETLSGSEQRGWQIVCALSLLRILPPSMRSNTIILDELEGNTDVKTRTRFVREAIPEVAKMVKQVVVVSPLSRKELPIVPQLEYAVRKSGGASKLVVQ